MKLKVTLLFLFTALGMYISQAQCSGAQFEEQGGYVVIEGESLNAGSSWRKESSKSGYTGTGYLIWRGTQYFSSPGNGLIQTTIRINTPGKYRFAWRNTIGIIANSSPTTEHNDSWLKFPDADEFYGEQADGSRVFPVGAPGTPKPNGASSGGWFKVYVNSLSYTWSTFTSDFDGHPIFVEFDSPGVYTLQISARSSGHIIDRMILHRVGSTSFSSATSLSRSQTFCDGSSPPPPPPPPPGENDPPTVSITSPSNGANFNAGTNVAINLNSSDPDGNISQHQIFVNNTLVDTDGASYTPHIMQNIQPGSYTIRARVTDTNGAFAESTINITAGSGNPPPPPPPPPPPGGNNPPTVSITSPTNGQNFNVGSNVSVNVSSSDSDGTVVKHQVFVDGILVDTDPSNYTPHVIQSIAAGSYNISVTVTDDDGATASANINITAGGNNPPPPPPPGGNNPPTVSITSPNNGQNFSEGSDVSINVSSNDSDGTVVKHQVFVDDILVDTDPSNYTPHIIRNIDAGVFNIRVTVTDDDGATASASISITVGSGPPPPPAEEITFLLIDAGTNNSIQTISNGSTLIDNSNINIRARTTLSGAASAYFRLSGPATRVWTENFRPFALYGDTAGNYAGVNLPGGSYSLIVEMWSGSNRTGSLLGTRAINFSVPSGTANAEGKGYVYPNPIENGQFSVKVPDHLQGEIGYSLISTSGAELKTGTFKVGDGIDQISFDEPSMNSSNDGIYYLVLRSKDQRYTIPIIKK